MRPQCWVSLRRLPSRRRHARGFGRRSSISTGIFFGSPFDPVPLHLSSSSSCHAISQEPSTVRLLGSCTCFRPQRVCPSRERQERTQWLHFSWICSATRYGQVEDSPHTAQQKCHRGRRLQCQRSQQLSVWSALVEGRGTFPFPYGRPCPWHVHTSKRSRPSLRPVKTPRT